MRRVHEARGSLAQLNNELPRPQSWLAYACSSESTLQMSVARNLELLRALMQYLSGVIKKKQKSAPIMI